MFRIICGWASDLSNGVRKFLFLCQFLRSNGYFSYGAGNAKNSNFKKELPFSSRLVAMYGLESDFASIYTAVRDSSCIAWEHRKLDPISLHNYSCKPWIIYVAKYHLLHESEWNMARYFMSVC